MEGFPPLGAAGEQALYPAHAGTQATLTIKFTAPLDAGTYRTAWQAYNPDGTAFGDAVTMEIIVGQ
jgi:methionine-rich copper-binding protein CopC